MKKPLQKKVLNYQTMIRRRNPVMDALLSFFLSLSSWPRLLLETLIRTRFGERYFSFSGAIVMTVLLAFYPVLKAYGLNAFSQYGYVSSVSNSEFILRYFTWYVYLCLFMYMAVQRRDEIKRLPSVFDFARYSLSTGYIHQFFLNYKIKGNPATIRQIETLLEPGVFFIAGLVLAQMGQSVGSLLMVSSVFYSLSYVAAYKEGDDYVMDMIDSLILNEQMAKAFIEDAPQEETKGFSFRGHRPTDTEGRKRFVETFLAEEEIVEAF